MTVPEPASTGTVAKTGELDLRRALTGLHELLVMSMAMLQRHDVDEVINVLAHAVESVTGCQLVHVTFQRHREWITLPAGEPTRPAEPSPTTGERVFVQDHGDSWTSTTAVAVVNSAPGQLVLRSSARPDPEQLFVIGRLGDLLGTALADAELHERHRRRALQLDAANDDMARTVAALQHREGVLEEFARLATTGTELDVATSLSRLTGSTIVLRDKFGHETTRITVAGRYQPSTRAFSNGYRPCRCRSHGRRPLSAGHPRGSPTRAPCSLSTVFGPWPSSIRTALRPSIARTVAPNLF
jgi:hypothetical protein